MINKIGQQIPLQIPRTSLNLTIQKRDPHPDMSPIHLLQELRKIIKSLNSGFQANLTLTFSIAGNGVVVVHGFGETLIEDASAWVAVPRPPPLPVEAGGFGFATRCAFLPGIAVANSFRIHGV